MSAAVSCATSGCKDYVHGVVLSVRNAYYVKKMRNNVIIYATYDGLLVT